MDLFKYFKGEKENPFDKEKQNPQYQFWGYEYLFEDKFKAGNFSPVAWIPPNAPDTKEWEKVLACNPIDKEKLFKIWLFNLVMIHLPEKCQSSGNSFLRLYNDTNIK